MALPQKTKPPWPPPPSLPGEGMRPWTRMTSHCRTGSLRRALVSCFSGHTILDYYIKNDIEKCIMYYFHNTQYHQHIVGWQWEWCLVNYYNWKNHFHDNFVALWRQSLEFCRNLCNIYQTLQKEWSFYGKMFLRIMNIKYFQFDVKTVKLPFHVWLYPNLLNRLVAKRLMS